MAFLYEVIRVIRKSPIFITEHLDRLERSMDLSDLGTALDRMALIQRIAEVIEGETAPRFNLLIQYDTENYSFQVKGVQGRYPTTRMEQEGIVVCTYTHHRHQPHIKQMDPSIQQKMEEEKVKQSCFELLYVDRGLILEASKANVFFIRGSQLITPPASGVLRGVTRDKIFEIAETLGISLRERKVRQKELSGFDAAFLSGTSINLLPIQRIDDLSFSVGHPMHRQLLHAYKKSMAEELLPLEKK